MPHAFLIDDPSVEVSVVRYISVSTVDLLLASCVTIKSILWKTRHMKILCQVPHDMDIGENTLSFSRY